MAKRQKDPLLKLYPGGYVNAKGRVFPTDEAAAPTARKHRKTIVKPKGKAGSRVPLKRRPR